MRKDSNIFPCGAFISCAVDKMFIKLPLFKKRTHVLTAKYIKTNILITYHYSDCCYDDFFSKFQPIIYYRACIL